MSPDEGTALNWAGLLGVRAGGGGRGVCVDAIPWSGMYRTCVLRMDAPRPRRELSSPPLCTPRRHPSKPRLSSGLLLQKIDWFS